MTDAQIFKGVWTALITPFHQEESLDLQSYRELIQKQIEAGVQGIIPCGTTGESPVLSRAEKQELIQIALEETKGTPVKVVAGTGSNHTAESVEFSRWASDQGVAGVLVVTPYYNKPTQAGLETHFLAIADRIDCALILYNVPGRTGVSLSAKTIATLAKHPKIRALKEATGNLSFLSEIRESLIDSQVQMQLLSGDDATYLPFLAAGGHGVISASSNLLPRSMVAIQEAWDQGRTEEALKWHQKVYPLFRDLFIESNPGPIKYAMARAGVGSSTLRPPLAQLSEGSILQLEKTLEKCGVKKGAIA